MTSRERPPPALDTNHLDDAPAATALALAEAAEAEAAAAEAEARAAAARARAIRLRRQADAPPPNHSDGGDTADPDGDGTAGAPAASTARSRRLRRPRRKTVAAGAATVLVCASLAASGYMAWQHRIVAQERQRAAEFAAAARQDVVTLMSLDFNKTPEDLQRIADNSTGNFKNHFPLVAEQLTKGLQQSKVVTTATVTDVAVESMTENSAVVLVAATTNAKSPDGAEQPRSWHIALGLTKDGGQPKMSNVEFVQ
ncbi:MAG: hypothetical protein ACRDTK_11260 [Mycobacterium sp.]